MGLYIPNMQMPTGGRILIVFPSGRVLEVSADETQDIFREAQAFPVPPHGRCINADALIKELAIDDLDDKTGATLLMAVFLEALKAAPTIIPADHIGDATNMIPEDGGEK